jgi:hypothetical protein
MGYDDAIHWGTSDAQSSMDAIASRCASYTCSGPIMTSTYDSDYYRWSQEQASLLRNGRLDALDILHLAEEIEDLGKRERRALESRLGVLLGHLLKWRFQLDYSHRKSWRATINAQRRSINKLLAENPSLRPQLPALIASAFADGRDLVVAETPLDYSDLPEHCPWTAEQVLDVWWPEPSD